MERVLGLKPSNRRTQHSSIDVILINCFEPYFLHMLMRSERAQISIEMIIVLAAVVTIVLLLVTQLQKTAEKGSKVFAQKTDSIFKQVGDI